MRTTATNRKVRLLLKSIREEALIPQPAFQRRLVWSNRHKQNFLKTVLQGLPFPEIYIAAGDVDPDTGEGTEMLVDGQQRITTLYQYFTDSSDLRLGPITSYSELSDVQKRAFLDYEVVVRDLGSKTIEEIKEIFTRINSTNYALNAMELHNARYEGEFKKFGEWLAGQAFFEGNRVFRPTEIRRMGDVRFCLVLVATVMSTYFNRDDDLDEFLAKYNDEFPEREDVREELERGFKFVDLCELGPTSRAWKKADLLTLLVEVHRIVVDEGVEADPKTVGARLADFYKKVDDFAHTGSNDKDVATYHRAAIQASNDRSSRVARGDVTRKVLGWH